MVHLTIPVSKIARPTLNNAKRLDSWIQSSYVTARHDPDNSDRHITSDLPVRVVSLRLRVRFRDRLDPHMPCANASMDEFQRDARAVDARATDPDLVSLDATMGVHQPSSCRIIIAQPHRA